MTGPFSGGPLIGRRAAQILARRELDKLTFWQRILRDLGRLFRTSASAVPGGWFGLIVFGILALALIIVTVTWARPTARRRTRSAAVLADNARSPHDYRRSAARLAQASRFGEAIVAGLRAIAAELDERGKLPPSLGRTADQLAVLHGRRLPGPGDEHPSDARP